MADSDETPDEFDGARDFETDDDGRNWFVNKAGFRVFARDKQVFYALSDAAQETGQTKANLQYWVKPDAKTGKSRIPGEQVGTGGRAPWYIDISALRAYAEGRTPKAPSTDMIPMSVLEEMNALHERILEEARERAKAETREEFFRENVSEKNKEITELKEAQARQEREHAEQIRQREAEAEALRVQLEQLKKQPEVEHEHTVIDLTKDVPPAVDKTEEKRGLLARLGLR